MEFVKSRARSSWDLFGRHRLSVFCLWLRNPFPRIRFTIHRWILRMKFLLERIFLRLFEFLFFSSSSSSSSFFYFRRNPSLDIEPSTYVFFTVALHANNIWWISVPCSRIQFFNLDRIEFAFLLKSCCWIPS